MDAWGAWFGSLGTAVIDAGNPVGNSSIVKADGSSAPGSANLLPGYSRGRKRRTSTFMNTVNILAEVEAARKWEKIRAASIPLGVRGASRNIAGVVTTMRSGLVNPRKHADRPVQPLESLF
jgi:hypothetical protein